MLNTRKLLYILPDVAYIAELLPTKKEHTFTVQAFRQINGEFLNEEEEFIPENIEKLFAKIEPETYYLILPDFLFTNTILEVKETNENKVKDYIKDELLPKLELTKDTHEIETFSLNQYNGSTKIQLTALERSILDPIVVSAGQHQVLIDHISPLTWTIKSIISLEPSISVLQIGSLVYVAEHYIGVDQCTMTKVDEIEDVIDTIKTLKGSQPSIQTVYLLTNSLVEQKLKEQVSATLPLQQLTVAGDEDSQMPSYVRQIIESGMKTLDISDFPVPSFVLPKHATGDMPLPAFAAPAMAAGEPDLAVTEPEAPLPPPSEPPIAPKVALAPETPTKPELVPEPVGEPKSESTPEPTISSAPHEVAPMAIAAMAAPTALSAATTAIPASKPLSPVTSSVYVPPATPQFEPADTTAEPRTTAPVLEKKDPMPSDSRPTTPERPPVWQPPASTSAASSVNEDDAVLARFAGNTDTAEGETSVPETDSVDPEPIKKPVIKNRDSGSSLLKMAFVSLVVFALTVAIGVGIGFGVLSINNRSQSAELPSPVISPSPQPTEVPSPVAAIATTSATPAPTASPTATASASLKKSSKILVVNATPTAGYATTTSNKLKAAGYTQVTAKNASGKYDPGFYILMAKEDPTTTKTLSQATGLDLTYQADKSAEDPSNQYQIVIVLGK